MSGGIVPIVALVFGAGVLLSQVLKAVRERRFVQSSLTAPGEVTDVREHERTRTSNGRSRTVTTYAPVVRFTLPDGRIVDAEVYERHGEAPPVGSAVEVRYAQDDPTHCRLDGGDAQRHGAAIGVVVFAVLLLAIGFGPGLLL